ncbi:MAG: S8 family serine peptidase, partial [Clostridium sp.]
MKKRLKRIVASAVIMCIVSSNSLVNNVITAYAETNDKEAVKASQIYGVNKNSDESLREFAEGLKGESVSMAYKAEEEVDIIVELESKPILEHYIEDNSSTTISSFTSSSAGRRISKKILQEQKNVMSRIQSEVSSDIELKAEYSVVINGFAVKAKYGDLEGIRDVNGVKNAFVANTYDVPTNPEINLEPFMVNSNGYIGATEANESGYTGKSTVVAVLDTGLDINHEAFQQVPESIKYSQEDINNITANTHLNAKGNVYKSDKIPFAYDYADGDENPADAGEHGTHVAGTVAANGEKIKGVAPDAQLMIMKVFGSNGGGASDRTILAALDDAVKLDADAINMSLGSAAGFTSEGQDVLDNTYNRVVEAGISLMCAAGNDESSTVNSNKGNLPLASNPDNSIVGSPSTYSAATSIASVNNIKSFAPYFTLGELKIKYSDSNKGTANDFATLQGENIEYVAVPGVGAVSDFEQVDVSGKIALVQRGTIAFTEKETNAHAYDAKGLIIYDNVDGALINMQTGGKLPMIAISKADGQAMVAAAEKKININEGYIDSFEDVTSGKMSDFSSWGVSPDLKLKPEITAPGGGIFSTLPGNSYGSMSGTSMASPHAAGAAALVRQYINEKSPGLTTVQEDELLTNLLMSTATPVIDGDGVLYSPRKQGAGLININSAIKSGAYITAPAGKPKAELGDSTKGEFNFEFDVNNTSENPLTYDLNTTVLTEKIISQGGETYFA